MRTETVQAGAPLAQFGEFGNERDRLLAVRRSIRCNSCPERLKRVFQVVCFGALEITFYGLNWR